MKATMRIDKRGRVVIPKEIRDRLRLIPGTRLTIILENGTLIIRRLHR